MLCQRRDRTRPSMTVTPHTNKYLHSAGRRGKHTAATAVSYRRRPACVVLRALYLADNSVEVPYKVTFFFFFFFAIRVLFHPAKYFPPTTRLFTVSYPLPSCVCASPLYTKMHRFQGAAGALTPWLSPWVKRASQERKAGMPPRWGCSRYRWGSARLVEAS